MCEYMYIRSKLGRDLVMDVAGACTNAGTQIQSFPRNFTNAQLWKKERLPDGRFYLVSKLGDQVKLQIQDGRAITSSFGSILYEVKREQEVLIYEQDTDKVLDIQGASTQPGTPIIVYNRSGENGSPNQRWEYYPEY